MPVIVNPRNARHLSVDVKNILDFIKKLPPAAFCFLWLTQELSRRYNFTMRLTGQNEDQEVEE